MLRLVLPKGSLEENTMRLFEEADLPPKRRSDREYNVEIDDPRIGQVKMLRPQEIPVYIERGYFDAGITGEDWVEETGSDVVPIMTLSYAKASLDRTIKIVLAVAEESGICRPEELWPGSRVSTEYPRITQRYFDQLGVKVEILPSYGATEAKVPEIADAIVDLTETGNSLRRHRMRIIDVLFESRTQLVANRASYEDPEKRRSLEEITTLLQGVLSARGRVLIKLNVAEEYLDKVISILPAMKAPTVSRLFGSNFYAVETVVVKSNINLLIPKLKQMGAEDILEMPISKVVP